MSSLNNILEIPADMPAHGNTHPLFVFCHGGNGCGTNVWFPFAHTEVAIHDCDFISPDCPTPFSPIYAEWKAVLLREIERKWNKKQPIIVVGHSLGGYTILRMLTECHLASEEWVKYVKGCLLVSPVVSPKLLPEGLVPLEHFAEIDFDTLVTLRNISFKHIFCTVDHALGSTHSDMLRKKMSEAKMKYDCLEMPTVECDSHFGGLKHFPVKEINDRLVSLMREIDPSL